MNRRTVKRSQVLEVTKVWEEPDEYNYGEVLIRVQLAHGQHEFNLCSYRPDQISVDMGDLLGLDYREATEHVLAKKRKYQKMLDLITPED